MRLSPTVRSFPILAALAALPLAAMAQAPSSGAMAPVSTPVSVSAPAAPPAPPHWEYTGPEGVRHWADIDPSFGTCAQGHAQSPINIVHAAHAALPALDFHYGPAVPTIVNNGHTVQVSVPPGNFVQVGERRFELLQFHFHTPSEEAINGHHTAMVAHFVHKDAEGKLGVVAVLLSPGAASHAFAPVFAHLPRPGEKVTVDGLTLDLPAMLPATHRYYAFTGSLTTPPCTEGVSWMVLETPVTLGSAQIAAFHHFFPRDARPVQALNGRVVQEGG